MKLMLGSGKCYWKYHSSQVARSRGLRQVGCLARFVSTKLSQLRKSDVQLWHLEQAVIGVERAL